jgi:hypothetical protein
MRDVKRIRRILDKIGILWETNPDWRLGQLLVNYGMPERSVFHFEDDKLEANLDEIIAAKEKK